MIDGSKDLELSGFVMLMGQMDLELSEYPRVAWVEALGTVRFSMHHASKWVATVSFCPKSVGLMSWNCQFLSCSWGKRTWNCQVLACSRVLALGTVRFPTSVVGRGTWNCQISHKNHRINGLIVTLSWFGTRFEQRVSSINLPMNCNFRHGMMASLSCPTDWETSGSNACAHMATPPCPNPSCEPKKLRHGHKHRLRKI